MLRLFVDDFIKNVAKQMPTLFNQDHISKPLIYNDYALLEWDLPEEDDIARLMDPLEYDMELVVLYHQIINQKEKEHCGCAYSNPNNSLMYKINVFSTSGGTVKKIWVTIYGSIEKMLADIRKDLTLHQGKGFQFQYERKETDVILDFIFTE